MRSRSLLACACALVAAACSSSSSSSPPSFSPPPASATVDDPGPVKIRREIFVVDGVAPPPAPNGVPTPPEQNKVRVVRWRVDADPPRPARAIVVMMPGFLASAGAFDGLARAVVRRSTADDALEAWAIDRRSNLLEDTWGLDVAEVKRDASIANRYYFDQEAVEGKSFAGIIQGNQIPWASEWGIATTIGDLRNVISLVPAVDRASRVVLLGHSLGASIVEEYAAWDFGGVPGYRDVAAIALVDGVAGSEGAAMPPLDRAAYENGPMMPGMFSSPGVNGIRSGNVYTTLPFLGINAYIVAEYTAMRARWAPADIVEDSQRDNLLGVFLGQTPMPKVTNAAALGFTFDSASCPLAFVAVSCGSGNGGAITPYTSLLGGMALHPSDPNATYGWTAFDKASPVENTSIDDFARGWFDGPGLNFAEWYFPSRLALDAQTASTLNVADTDWRASAYGLLAKHGAEIDVPILAIALALVKDASKYDALKALVAPIGAGRVGAGKPRTDPDAFTATAMPELTHVDGISGTDVAGSPVARWYDMLVAFAKKQTPTGGVVVPIRK